MENKDQIIDKIEKLRSEYKVELEDSQEDTLSFLDRIDDLIKSIFNDSSISVYDAFSQENLDKWKKRRLFRFLKNLITNNLQNTLYFILLATITGFLVSEALEFYADSGVLDTKTYAKAILTEVCFIFLSGYRSNNTIQKIGVGVLRGSIFVLMLFVITSKTFVDSTKNTGNSDSIQEQVVLVQEQIKQKEVSIKYYQERNWPSTTRQLIKEKDELVVKLIDLKQQQAKGANQEVSKLVEYQAYGKAFFRVLLLFISILITRRIFKF
jgi:hypothetical protein